MPSPSLPAASLSTRFSFPAGRAVRRVANQLIYIILSSIAQAVFGREAKFVPALREGDNRGSLESRPSGRRAILHQGLEGGTHGRCPGLAEQLFGRTDRPHLAPVQHDDPRAVADFVDQMRRPQCGDALLAAEPAHMVEHELPAGDVEPDGRLVEQQQPRPVQQATGDLDPAALAAAQPADLVAKLIGEAHPVDFLAAPARRLAMRHTMQGGMVEQVLLDREVEVEGWLLKDDADLPQALRGLLADIQAKDTDDAFALEVEPGSEGEQRRLP